MTSKRGRPNAFNQPDCPLAAEIRVTREKADLSQEEAAELMGVSRRTWQRWELGEGGMRAAIWGEWLMRIKAPERAMLLISPSPEQIRERRVGLGLTQVAAARLAGVSYKTWQDWEAGRAAMHGAIWKDWCRVVASFQNTFSRINITG